MVVNTEQNHKNRFMRIMLIQLEGRISGDWRLPHRLWRIVVGDSTPRPDGTKFVALRNVRMYQVTKNEFNM